MYIPWSQFESGRAKTCQQTSSQSTQLIMLKLKQLPILSQVFTVVLLYMYTKDRNQSAPTIYTFTRCTYHYLLIARSVFNNVLKYECCQWSVSGKMSSSDCKYYARIMNLVSVATLRPMLPICETAATYLGTSSSKFTLYSLPMQLDL